MDTIYDHILEIKNFQLDFDRGNGLEGHAAGVVFTAMCLAGENGEFAEAVDGGMFGDIQEELTDVFVYSVIASNKLDMIPSLVIRDLGLASGGVNALQRELTKAVGRFCEAVKKHDRAVKSQNGNETMRRQAMLQTLNDLFDVLDSGARMLSIDLVKSYFDKMAINQAEIKKYKG